MAIEDLDRLQATSRPLRREAEEIIKSLAINPYQGKPLRREWAGCRGLHFGSDRYRLIWEILPAEEDYQGTAGEHVVPVVILRIGPKADQRERIIYDQPRPPTA